MTKLIEQAIAKILTLPEHEQDALAMQLLAMAESGDSTRSSTNKHVQPFAQRFTQREARNSAQDRADRANIRVPGDC